MCSHTGVFVFLCSPSCTEMYKSNTLPTFPSLFLVMWGFNLCACVFHLLFSSTEMFIFLLSRFFSFASVCKTLNSCDQAWTKLTFIMSKIDNIGFGNESGGSHYAVLAGGQFASMCMWQAQNGDNQGCGEGGRNPKLMLLLTLIW